MDEGTIVDDFAPKSVTHSAYKRFRIKNKLAILSERKFGKYLSKDRKMQEGRRGGHIEYWIGVRLNCHYVTT